MNKAIAFTMMILSMIFLGSCADKTPKFTADWPEPPDYEKKGFAHLYTVDKDDSGYLVTMIEFDKNKVKESGQMKFLEDHQNSLKRNWAVNKVHNRKDIKYGDNPGLEYEILSSMMKMKARTYMIENRLYSIAVVVKPNKDWPEDADRFIQSFKVQ